MAGNMFTLKILLISAFIILFFIKDAILQTRLYHLVISCNFNKYIKAISHIQNT